MPSMIGGRMSRLMMFSPISLDTIYTPKITYIPALS